MMLNTVEEMAPLAMRVQVLLGDRERVHSLTDVLTRAII